MFLIKKKLSDFNISTRLNWTSPTETLQEKEKNDPLHVIVGCKVMKLLPRKVCQNPCQNHNAHARMEFLMISVFNMFKWLLPTKTKMSHFTHFLMFFLKVLLILSRYDTKISRLCFHHREVRKQRTATINGPNTFWPNEIVVLTLK